MTILGDEPKTITDELRALTERRRSAGGPRRSWASPEPFLAGRRQVLEGDEGATWRRASGGYVMRAAIGDVLAVLGTFSLVVLVGRLSSVDDLVPVLLGGLAFLVAVVGWHGYDGRAVGDGAREFQAVLRAGLAAFIVPALMTSLAEKPLPREHVLALAVLLTVDGVVARRLLRRSLHSSRRHGLAMARTLVVGDADSVHATVVELRRSTEHGYRVVGMCLPAVTDQPPQDGVPLLGALADIVQVAYDYRIETVVVAGGELRGDALRRLSWALGHTGADLVVAPGLIEVLGPRVTVRPTAGLSLLEVETVAPRRRLLAKSLLDRVAGMVLLVLACPAIGVAALAVKFTSPGPVLFRQRRVGVDGRPFTLVKLRSMYIDAEERRGALLAQSHDGNGVLFKMHDDPRITRVGRWLRRFSVDELPQLWNVARGDMSLVGPRPPLPEEVDSYQDEVFRRLHVRPGLTGLWQVSGRSDLSWEKSVHLDLRYVDNWSVSMDLLILWKTARAVLRGAGAY